MLFGVIFSFKHLGSHSGWYCDSVSSEEYLTLYCQFISISQSEMYGFLIGLLLFSLQGLMAMHRIVG